MYGSELLGELYICLYVISKYTNFKIILHTAHVLIPVQLRNHCSWPCELADRRPYVRLYLRTWGIPYRVEIFVFFSKEKAMDLSSTDGSPKFESKENKLQRRRERERACQASETATERKTA